ncbi:MAG: tetratricopeptide repeat protein [Nitrospirae bacterium]|nr:MAG: tetratricopeptide repeat protein [Nitrospirota bacterium]
MADKAAIIKEAQKYLARGQIDKAIAEWEKLAKESPDANTFNTIGDLYFKKGDKVPAIDFFHKAAHFFRDEGFSLKALALYKKILNTDPSNTDAMNALGELSEEKGLATDAIKYYLASADILSREGKKDALLKTYDRILNLSPSNISLRNKIAELFIKEGLQIEAAKEYLHIARLYDDKDDHNNARDYFKKALQFQPNNKEALLGLSSVFEKAGDSRQSLEHVKKAIELSPQDAALSLKYAQLLVAQESFAEALPYVTKIIEAEPSNITAKKLLGEIYLKEGDEQKAWAEYSSVIDEMVFEEKIDEAIETLILFKDVEPVETRKKLVSLYKQKENSEAAFTELVFLGDTFVLSDGMLKEALNCYREALQIHPDDAVLEGKAADIARELGEEEPAAAKPEKSVVESLAEADIFLRYGLYDEAKTLLESLKVKEPQDIDIHLKLKSLYMDTGDKEQAVTECLVLAELYSRAGNIEQREVVLKEAYEINPEDPRLLERAALQPSAEFIAPVSETAATGLNIENYSEDLSEAEFYARQGLHNEARAIYERLLNIFPDNEEIKQKLLSADIQMPEVPTPEQIVAQEEITEKPVEKPFEEFTMPEALEAHEAPEPALENDVLDIFEEFKKGLEKEVGSEDSETHYNLGIAYKEMGLIDDAIREFQVSKNDPKRFTQSINMLGICYMSKGLFSLAIESFGAALGKIETRDESYWGVNYDLAEAYEKNGDTGKALALYTDIYGWNSKFRNVSEKINLLKVMLAKSPVKPVISEKQKIKKERVSYL